MLPICSAGILVILAMLSIISALETVQIAVLSFSLAHVLSIKSIALSGNFLSVWYLTLKSTAASIASGVTVPAWNFSNEVFNPLRISLATCVVGSSTVTRWKRRINARSFSKLVVYSSQVVLAITLILPLVNAGLIMLLKSTLPCEPAPAPRI